MEKPTLLQQIEEKNRIELLISNVKLFMYEACYEILESYYDRLSSALNMCEAWTIKEKKEVKETIIALKREVFERMLEVGERAGFFQEI